MTPKKRKALENYLRGMSKKDAMLEAGYSESMATTRPHDVFSDPEVVKEIERRQKIASARSDVTLEWIVEKLKSIANAELGDIIDFETGQVDISKITPDLRIALTGYSTDEYKEGRGKGALPVKKTRVQLADKLRALELLIKHLGLSKEKTAIEVSGSISLSDRLQRARIRAGLVKEEDNS